MATQEDYTCRVRALSLSQLHLSTIISCFTLPPEDIEQVSWYTQVCELLANMVDQDSHEQDVAKRDWCMLLLAAAL